VTPGGCAIPQPAGRVDRLRVGVPEPAQVNGQRPVRLGQRQHGRLPEQGGRHVAVHEQRLARLANNAHERTFPAGTVLTEQDETGVTFGVIMDGQAAVSVHGRAARTLGPGDYFGEMALIDHSYRSATITADTDMRCLCSTPTGHR
jgi:CRP-like cAMP-binding protein